MVDHKSLGLKAGLEIHQQLDTGKLFCSCPSVLRSDAPSGVVSRVLRPVVGESGEVDAAALHESSKGLRFDYQFFDSTCAVELDEEPPHRINQDSLFVALQIAFLLNAKVFPVSQVMRKIVVDGSNTSGFQRTLLIAYDGVIETSEGPIGIETIALEEDSARKVSHDGVVKTYSLDRLGIPLVEITTKPDLRSPSQIKEAALKIGEVLRACRVRRGIGTIRQDVNVSITGSKRVEIKGFQDPKMMERTVELEMLRQRECLKDGSCAFEVRRALPDGSTEFLRPMPGSARMYPETDHPLVKFSRRLLDDAKKSLPKLASEHKSYLQEFGLNDELIVLLLKQNLVEDFKVLSKVSSEYALIAKMLTLFVSDLSSKTKKSESQVREVLDLHVLEAVLDEVGKNISSSDVLLVLEKVLNGIPLKDALVKEEVDLDSAVKRLLKEKPGLNQGAYMGLLMKEFKGKVRGKEISDALRKQL